ncbi:MAG: transglycosylase SLT domain-containing protein [Desulfobacterales bacterium]
MAGTSIQSDVRAESDSFPEYTSIQPNVNFWAKIYTKYGSDNGVIHDKRNMNIIYGVIELVDPDRYRGRRINKSRIKKAKKKFKAILTNLSQGIPPSGPVETHVAGFFGANTQPTDYQRAIRNLRCQVGQKDRFREGVIRSGAYIDEIKRIFRDYGLPEDLVYLPHVESSFNTKAYSKFGAAGIWQFTRSTGRHFMKVGYTIDERRDPIISSHAAAKLLRQNYRKFKNWPMAITAYNHGVTGMLRAKRKKGDYERIFKEYRSRSFRFASRNFYSEFLAAREAAKNYRQYFGDLQLDVPIKTKMLVLAGYVSFPDVARHFDLDIAELHKLNPALRNPVIRGTKYVPRGYRLNLPEKDGERWQSLMASLPEKFYKPDQKKSRIYAVRRGDTAGEIARIHGVKLADLIAANNLNTKATIYVNQTLRIPIEEEKATRLAKHVPDKSGRKQNPIASQSPKIQNASKTESPGQTNLVLASRSAEQSSEQADAGAESARPLSEEVTSEPASEIEPEKAESDVAEQDKMADSPPAQKLQDITAEASPILAIAVEQTANSKEVSERLSASLPKPGSESETSPDTTSGRIQPEMQEAAIDPEILVGHFVVERIWNQNGKPVGLIRVEIEETLGHYADWLGVTAWQIRRLNGFRYGRVLHLNEKIKIPLHGIGKEEFEEKRYEYHKELIEDFFASYRVEKVHTYSVKHGDNIWTLSHETFEVPLWLLKRYNAQLDFNTLMPLQKIRVPIVEKNA